MVEAGYSATANFPPPPPPMAAPPPVLEPPAQMMAPAPGQAPWGYGYTASMPPPEMAPPAPEKPPAKPSRNPRPQPMDMSAMIAAAQQHMQKNLTAKLASIGVPLSTFGMSTSQPSDTESIPLPGDPSGVDINIADIPTPSADIPLPPGPTHTGPVTLSDDCVPPGDDEDCAPPGNIHSPTILEFFFISSLSQDVIEDQDQELLHVSVVFFTVVKALYDPPSQPAPCRLLFNCQFL